MTKHHFPTWGYHLLFLLILICGIAIRIAVLDVHRELAPSDEGEYLIMAQSFARGEILAQWPYYRPYLLPFLWSILLRLGFGIPALSLLLLFFSAASLVLLYLLGKELFHPLVGIIASLYLAILPDEIANSTHLLANSAALTLWLLPLYLFQKALFTHNTRASYACALSTGIAIMLYTQNIALLPLYMVTLLMFHGPRIMQKKHTILLFLIPLLFYTLNFLYSWRWFGNPLIMTGYGLQLSLIDTSSRSIFSVITAFFTALPHYLSWYSLLFALVALFFLLKTLYDFTLALHLSKKVWKKTILTLILVIIPFLILALLLTPTPTLPIQTRVLRYALRTLLTLIIGLAVLFTCRTLFTSTSKTLQHHPHLQKPLFLTLWFFGSFSIIATIVGPFQPRYFLPTLVPLFLAIGFTLTTYAPQKIKKIIYTFAIITLLTLTIIVQLHALPSTLSIYEAEQGTRAAGLWIRAHTTPGDIILGSSNTVIAYYAERQWRSYPARASAQKDYAGLLDAIYTLQPSYLVLYYYAPENVPANQLYFEFLSKNKEATTLVYTTTTNRNSTIAIYRINTLKTLK